MTDTPTESTMSVEEMRAAVQAADALAAYEAAQAKVAALQPLVDALNLESHATAIDTLDSLRKLSPAIDDADLFNTLTAVVAVNKNYISLITSLMAPHLVTIQNYEAQASET